MSTPLNLSSASAMDVGLQRDEMEDGIHVHDASGCYAVIDGMGGHRTGYIITDFIVKALNAGESTAPGTLQTTDLNACFNEIEQAFREFQSTRGLKGQDASCAMLRVMPPFAVISFIGNARAYLWRDGNLTALNTPHTLVHDYSMLDMDHVELAHYGHLMTRAMGMSKGPEERVLVAHKLWMPRAHDRVLLCTDGLSDYLDDAQLALHLGAPSGASEVAAALLNDVLTTAAADNIALIVVDVCDMPAMTPTPPPSLDFGEWRSVLHMPSVGSWEAIVRFCDEHVVTQEQVLYAQDQLSRWPQEIARATPTSWLMELLHMTRERPELVMCDTLSLVPGLLCGLDEFRTLLAHPTLHHITAISCGHDTLSDEILRHLAMHPVSRRLTKLVWNHEHATRHPVTVTMLLESEMLSDDIKRTIPPLTAHELDMLGRLKV